MSAYLLRRSGYIGGARAGAEQAFAAALLLLLLRPGSPPRKVERHLGFLGLRGVRHGAFVRLRGRTVYARWDIGTKCG